MAVHLTGVALLINIWCNRYLHTAVPLIGASLKGKQLDTDLLLMQASPGNFNYHRAFIFPASQMSSAIV